MQFTNVNVEDHFKSNSSINILYYGISFKEGIESFFSNTEFTINQADTLSELKKRTHAISFDDINTIILLEVEPTTFEDIQTYVSALKSNFLTKNLITIFLLTEPSPAIVKKAMELGISDCYINPVPFDDLKERLKFLSFYKLLRSQVNQLSQVPVIEYYMPVSKRLLDILLSSISLIILFPFFLIVSILIKLDSKGPVFYTSKRVGTGYKIFDFYKFRSMRVGADAEIASLAHKNQYSDASFFKIENDPRVTKLGAFLRNSSIDELPQLLNVLKGDMSLVGNRPLPLYEAEQLTTNEWSMRFLGPAGLTGLWQISKRGKKEMSDHERKKLDNFYAKNYSMWLDLKIILKTVPALVQKEKV
ncbi:sugar transferase [Pedobacter arcticus]|uniref:sugar transferase n=1 Tax=Pedobacter arcticus TaxID=752140 RepID=UPI0002DE823D|nr:sugar transferase [Pedobacter arcticus]